jgi:hypothetical protein
MVAFKHGLRGVGASVWIQVIYGNFGDVGIHTLRQFIASVLTGNDKLIDSGHRQLEAETMSLTIAEVCDMMFGLEQDFDVVEPGQDRHLE